MNEYERHMGAAGDPTRTGNQSGERERSPEEIQREIEMTRERMSQNIDELGERLSPENLKRQAKEAITGKAHDVVNNVGYQARDTGSRVFDFIRDNPLPVAAVTLGAGWLLRRRQRAEEIENVSGDRMARFAYTGPERRRGGGSGWQGGGQFGGSVSGASGAYGETGGWEGSGGERREQFDYETHERGGRGAMGGVPAIVRDNSLLLAALGFTAVWLVQQRGQGEVSGDRMARYSYEGAESEGTERRREGFGGRLAERAGQLKESVSGAASNVAERAGELAGSARERAGELAGSARERAGGIAGSARERVSDLGSGARERVGNLGTRAREQTRRARGGLEQAMEENPLAVVAGSAVLGLLVGLLVPETEREHRLMGPARDQLVDRAQSTARRVKDAAVEAGQEVREAVREEVQHRTPELKATLKDAAQTVTAEVKDAAGRVKDQAAQAAKERPV